jgi:hypothetical protein
MTGRTDDVSSSDVNRTSRLGAQVVRINADLLHFQSAPSASESSIGGVDLIGAKVAAQASARNAIMSKGCFIAVLPFPPCPRLAAFLAEPVVSGVGFCVSSRAGNLASSNGTIRFVAAWPTKPLHGIAIANPDVDWPDLDGHRGR